MIELHGWLSILATYKDEDLIPQSEVDSIKQSVKDIVSNSEYKIDLQYVNGSAFINTLYCSNHRTREIDAIIEIYRHISEVATGSYGLIYIRDDEDKNHYNEFQVYVSKEENVLKKMMLTFLHVFQTLKMLPQILICSSTEQASPCCHKCCRRSRFRNG